MTQEGKSNFQPGSRMCCKTSTNSAEPHSRALRVLQSRYHNITHTATHTHCYTHSHTHAHTPHTHTLSLSLFLSHPLTTPQITDVWMLADHHAAGVFLSKPQGASEWRDLQGWTNAEHWTLLHRSFLLQHPSSITTFVIRRAHAHTNTHTLSLSFDQ